MRVADHQRSRQVVRERERERERAREREGERERERDREREQPPRRRAIPSLACRAASPNR